MQTTTFGIEYYNDTPEFTDEMREKVEQRLDKLARGKSDIHGATVTIVTNCDSTPKDYHVRIALQQRSGQAIVTERGDAVAPLLSRALAVLERQVRDGRNKKRSIRRRQGNGHKGE